MKRKTIKPNFLKQNCSKQPNLPWKLVQSTKTILKIALKLRNSIILWCRSTSDIQAKDKDHEDFNEPQGKSGGWNTQSRSTRQSKDKEN